MEKSRSLFQQSIGHKMIFVIILLFPMDILAENVTITYMTTLKNMTASLNISTPPFPASSNMTTEISVTSVTSPPDATMSGHHVNRSLNTSGQSTLSLKTVPPVSQQELPSTMAVNIVVPENTSFSVSTKGKHPRTEATETQESKSPPRQKEVSSKTTAMPHLDKETTAMPHLDKETTAMPHLDKETTAMPYLDEEFSPTKDFGTKSQVSFLKQSSSATTHPETTKSTEPKQDTKGPVPPIQVVPELTQTPKTSNHSMSSSFTTHPEATKSTEPKQDTKGPVPPIQVVPELTQTPETSSHSMSSSFTISATPINNTAIVNSTDKSSSERKYSVIVLAIVCSILLLIGLLAFLYFRRRRHSGSTSFNSPEWAGQATLPDDTGLDKDVEQQAGSIGEGETRRGTLVTFFGKRQSRVPSIAMEDINGKGGKEETEQLLGEEAELGSGSEAMRDANGKVPEPLRKSSQKSSASTKLGESSS